MKSWKTSALILTLCIPFLTRDLPLRAQEGKGEKKQGERGKKDQEKGAEKGGEKGERKGRRDEKKREEVKTYDLATQGTLGAPAKGGGDFYELTYTVTEGKKASKKKAWVKIDSGSQLRRDRMAGLAEFKEGESIQVFAKPFDPNARGGNYGGVNSVRILQASRVVIGGKDVSVNASYKDPKDKTFQWCSVTVTKPGAALTVDMDGTPHRVALDKPAAVMIREEGVLKRDVRKGAKVYFEGNSVSEKPSGEEEDLPAFRAEQVLVIEARAGDWYKALLP